MTDDADSLLAGSRGRRLCFMLAGGLDSGVDLEGLALPDATLQCLVHVVSTAMYWQQPDSLDQRLAQPGWGDFLRPTALEVCAAPENTWWHQGPPLDGQFHLEWLDRRRSQEPRAGGVRDELALWRTSTLREEADSDREALLGEPISGTWWSSLTATRVPRTSRALHSLPAITAALMEDESGEGHVRRRTAAVPEGARVYEIDGPDSWIGLVARFPLDVTWSRRHDWYQVTGERGPWLIPDYLAMAAEYDAVHLSLWGHLTTAGRPLQVGDHQTMLAGWNPDETYWLSDVIELSESYVDFRVDEDDILVWHPVET